jgi:circadian clock protein KaiC
MHTYAITSDGVEVYPTLDPSIHNQAYTGETLSSGVPEIDNLLNGGIERGTATVLAGPSGVGKTTFGAQFINEAAGRGDQATIYMFEETGDTFRERCDAVNIPVTQMEEQGALSITEIEALTMSANEFAFTVRQDIEDRGTDVVMIDGAQGYRRTVVGTDDELLNELHALIRYLKNAGVTVILTSEIPNVTGDFEPTDFGGSYLADTLIFQRHIELEGQMRKAIGVLKKRTSDYERTLREFQITEHGITVGEPLTELRGILTGTPELVDEATPVESSERMGPQSVRNGAKTDHELAEIREILTEIRNLAPESEE